MTDTCHTAPTTAAAVANFFLDLYNQEKDDDVPPIDPLKLQKLLYYAHAWHLALKDAPLFDEDIEAWPWGPVVRDIYIQFKDYKRDPITRHAVHLDADSMSLKEPPPPPDETKEFLRLVWEAHKKYNGIQLSNSTHAKGEPWEIVKSRVGRLDSKPTIPNDLIQKIFKGKLSDG